MSKNIVLAAIAVIAIGAGYYIYSTKPLPFETEQDLPASEAATDTAMTEESKSFTMNEVAVHNTAGDCWLAISGSVYDVTQFIADGKHGGGDAIIEGCGNDATELFNTRPMGSGTPHSDKARGFLPNFQIGVLAE